MYEILNDKLYKLCYDIEHDEEAMKNLRAGNILCANHITSDNKELLSFRVSLSEIPESARPKTIAEINKQIMKRFISKKYKRKYHGKD